MGGGRWGLRISKFYGLHMWKLPTAKTKEEGGTDWNGWRYTVSEKGDGLLLSAKAEERMREKQIAFSIRKFSFSQISFQGHAIRGWLSRGR